MVLLMLFTLVRSGDGLCFNSLSYLLAKEVIKLPWMSVRHDNFIGIILLYEPLIDGSEALVVLVHTHRVCIIIFTTEKTSQFYWMP